MRGTVVAVLRGGPSREHEVSLKSGHTILSNLPTDRFTTRDIYIDKQGLWHERGMPTTPDRVLRGVDVVLLGLHGEYGEDGEVQKLLERFGVPYAGADSFGSYLAMHKVLSKERAREAGLLTPKYRYVEEGSDIAAIARDVNRTFLQPVIVKPVKWGSSVGVSIVHGYAPLEAAVRALMEEGAEGVLIEEVIKGTEATAGVVEGLRGEALYGLPPVEILPPEKDFFSYDAKYSGASREIVPGRFQRSVTDELIRQARVMHGALGLRHYSRSDFIVSPKGIYYLETNTLPGLTQESLLPKSLVSVGVTLPDFFTHLADLALHK
ncbi:MAG: D-alanine--D-alanine ligase [Candidatus Pacebacteria bacterium]|nr:D-alanine--D-alanine ligase [Candidatus Paceibacterota bacterium]